MARTAGRERAFGDRDGRAEWPDAAGVGPYPEIRREERAAILAERQALLAERQTTRVGKTAIAAIVAAVGGLAFALGRLVEALNGRGAAGRPATPPPRQPPTAP